MNPVYDVVLSLLETPFSRRSDDERREILQEERPVPKISALTKDKKDGRQYVRAFQSSWYTTYKWICGSFYKQRAAKIHDSSKEHMQNSLSFTRLQQNKATILDALRENAHLSKLLFNENVRKNRLLMTYLIDTTILLGMQELPFRGHDESETSLNRGNFKEIFSCIIKRNEEISKHLKENKNIFTGQSKTIQNELISCISQHMLNVIKQEILISKFFSIIVDDTTDIFEKSQCSITVRYIGVDAEIKERFLEPLNFKTKLIAQCFDGAAVMAGEINGLQTQIRGVAPNALFTHCCAHRLNLVLQQGANSIPPSRHFFATLNALSTFFHRSAKRTSVLDTILGKRAPQSNDTRWYTRSKILFFVSNEWDKLINVFTTIANDLESSQESMHLARGFLNNFSEFEFAFLTFVFKEVFLITDILYQVLQKSNLNIRFSINQINIATSRLIEMRTEKQFTDIFEKSKTITELPQNKTNVDNAESAAFERYKRLYYEIVDCISFQLKTRFQDLGKLEFVSLLDNSKYQQFSKEFPR
ncbi:hypothetical protein NQ317_006632 [Molorchus minor]|uniref:DUF4371 domain-containing protein n=1 Tax=Molorchus minor TaxID=1323400 RepID=A0ABQ9J0K0_9CUCU|nr:hypothetical protein NQ317_006632 [Molorchus minor]